MYGRILLGALASAVMVSAAVADIAPADIQWVDETAIPASLTGVAGDPVAGAAVLSTRSAGNCVACHVITAMPDVTFQGNIGPALDGAGSRWDEAQLRGILVDAKNMFYETIMPSFYRNEGYIRPGDAYTARAANPETFTTLLTAQQVEDAVAYLRTLTE
jgi:sulfur-oxidizing protein SoxX